MWQKETYSFVSNSIKGTEDSYQSWISLTALTKFRLLIAYYPNIGTAFSKVIESSCNSCHF